jgi:predicted O-methyltransferase YrrM
MSATQRLLQRDPTLKLYREGDWNNQSTADPFPPGFSSFNSGGIEAEVGELLYSFVRVLKPHRILETGTHLGVGAAYMALGCVDNQMGCVDTLEFMQASFEAAFNQLLRLNLKSWVNLIFVDSTKFKPQDNYQLILLDTLPQLRFGEMLKYYPSLAPGGYLFIHDCHPHMYQCKGPDQPFGWPFGVMPEELRVLVHNGHLRAMHFPNPRGMTAFYKPRSTDFVWSQPIEPFA